MIDDIRESEVQKSVEFLNDTIINISLVFIPSLLGLLGLTLSGFAFVSGTISLKATKNIYQSNKMKSLESIFFTFYFLSWIIGFDIVAFIFIYLLGLSNWEINYALFAVLTFIISYLTFFITFYCIGLFHTCINIFFVNYKYNTDEEDEEN